jgi:hypothetical protein
MSAQDTAAKIIRKTENAVSTFTGNSANTQREIMAGVAKLIRQLELDAQGLIKPNTANLRIIRTLRDDINSIVVSPAYLKRVERYMKTFPDIKAITDQLYSTLSTTFNPNNVVFKNVLELSTELTRNSLTSAGIDSAVISPIVEQVTKGITSGANILDMEEDLRTYIVGEGGRLGRLQRYTSQITRDALNQFSRNYNKALSNNLSMEWYYYSGSVIEDTRTYCTERAGKYFHKKEVEQVPADWSGRIPGTNSSTIFVNAGGYNCRHIWMPVLIDVVPRSVVDRNISNGNYVQR